jgi:O-antigen ligase
MDRSEILTKETKVVILSGLFGAAIGWLTQNAVEQATQGRNIWPAMAPFMVPVLLLVVGRPVLGAVAVMGFGFVNPSLLPPLIEVGEFSLRYVDGVFGLLICVVLVRRASTGSDCSLANARELFVPLLLFFAYVGVSVLLVHISMPSFTGASSASYMRLLLTASFAAVLRLVTRNMRDMQLFHKGLIFFCVATVALGAALVWGGGADALSGRSGGLIGIGQLGLVSGLLILYSLVERDGKRRSMTWMFPLGVGLFGLYLAKTASAAFAVAVTAAVYLVTMRSRRVGFVRLVVVTTIMTTAAALAVWSVRQHDVSGFVDSTGGSFAERLIIAYAGIQIFLDNPLLGVGWQASTAEPIISSPAVVGAVQDRFPQLVTDDFFLTPPSTLHNMYIQFLAELGIIGFALFAWVCFRTAKSVSVIIGNISADSLYRASARFYALGLIFLLVSWNSNPLFGGQIETMLAFTFLALLGNVAQLERQRLAQLPV